MSHPLDWAGSLPAKGCLRRGQPRDWNPEWRTGHIVEPDLVAEPHPGRAAAMLAANADLELRAGLAPAFDPDAHQFADALAVDRHERIRGQDATRGVGPEKACGIVAADTEGGPRSIVGG